MARKPRFTIPGVPQHIIQRGNNRDPCFFSVADYSRYLEILEEAAQKNDVAIHSYVLMTNHVHLLATPNHKHANSHMMQDIGRKYVRFINRSYQRSGTLWEGRFKASLIDSEAYLLTCMRYIELNPVRAMMVNTQLNTRGQAIKPMHKGQQIFDYNLMLNTWHSDKMIRIGSMPIVSYSKTA